MQKTWKPWCRQRDAIHSGNRFKLVLRGGDNFLKGNLKKPVQFANFCEFWNESWCTEILNLRLIPNRHATRTRSIPVTSYTRLCQLSADVLVPLPTDAHRRRARSPTRRCPVTSRSLSQSWRRTAPMIADLQQQLRLITSSRAVFVRFSLGGGSEFRLAMTDRATIAGMDVAKLVSGV